MTALARAVEASSAVRGLVRWRWPLLVALTLGLALASSLRLHRTTDWGFFTWGGDLLVGDHAPLVREHVTLLAPLPGGMHTYANYPFLQIGPSALVLGELLQWGPHHGALLGGLVVAGCGLGFLAFADRAFSRAATVLPRLGWLVAAALVLATWGQITHYHHVDDALTLLGTAAGAVALRRGMAAPAGLALGFAAAAKPWGAPLICLVLALPSWRLRVRAGAVAAATVALLWGPFVLADRRTLDVGRVGLWLSPDSVIHALGVHDGGSGSTLRLGQLLGGALLVAVLVWRGAWWTAPLAAFAWRLGLDPATYPYYAVALVAAAYLADRGSGRTVPWLTYACAPAVMLLPQLHGDAAGWARLALYGTLLVGALLQRGPAQVTADADELTSAAPSGPRSRPTRGLPEAA